MARAEGELRDANKAMDDVLKEANTVNQERNSMHTEKRTRDKRLRDSQVSGGGGGGGGCPVLSMCSIMLTLVAECC